MIAPSTHRHPSERWDNEPHLARLPHDTPALAGVKVIEGVEGSDMKRHVGFAAFILSLLLAGVAAIVFFANLAGYPGWAPSLSGGLAAVLLLSSRKWFDCFFPKRTNDR